jgi:hypothetical protein
MRRACLLLVVLLIASLFVLSLTFIGCSQRAPSTSSANVASSTDSTPVLLPVKVSGKWGYVNGTGQLVINPQFDYAEEFQEGRAGVCLGKPCDFWDTYSNSPTVPNTSQWGFIDTSGKVVITPQYPEVSAFSEGVAEVCTGDCSAKPTQPFSRGYIDRDGKMVIPSQFGTASSFSEGLAQVCVGKCIWQDNVGYGGKFGFIDHSGHFVINPQYDNVGDFKNGYAKVFIGVGTNAKTGYIDKMGKTIWQPSN